MKALVVVGMMSAPAFADPLTVEIKPATLTWKLKAKVDVVLKVSNPAKKKQTMKVMVCSWEDHWKSSDAELTWESWGCDKNYPGTVELAPGASREWTLQMFATEKAKVGVHPLAMTFTPEGLAATKSNTVTITVAR